MTHWLSIFGFLVAVLVYVGTASFTLAWGLSQRDSGIKLAIGLIVFVLMAAGAGTLEIYMFSQATNP